MEERTASACSGEAPNDTNSTATATPPRWSQQGVGLVSIRNLGEREESSMSGGLLIGSREQAARHGDSGGAVATARAVRPGRYRGYREKKEILRKPPYSYFLVLFFLRQQLK